MLQRLRDNSAHCKVKCLFRKVMIDARKRPVSHVCSKTWKSHLILKSSKSYSNLYKRHITKIHL